MNREQAISLGVPVPDVFDALQSTLRRALRERLQHGAAAPTACRCSPRASSARSPTRSATCTCARPPRGEMIPLTALLHVTERRGPGAGRSLQRLPRRQGAGLRQARRALGPGDRGGGARRRREPARRATRSRGAARRSRKSAPATQSIFAFGLAIVMVYLILAALYERWRLPSAVVLAVPFAVLGALGLVCAARHGERHLLPDRPRGADRPRGEERDPDRGIRAAGLARGHERARTRRCRPRACASARS